MYKKNLKNFYRQILTALKITNIIKTNLKSQQIPVSLKCINKIKINLKNLQNPSFIKMFEQN